MTHFSANENLTLMNAYLKRNADDAHMISILLIMIIFFSLIVMLYYLFMIHKILVTFRKYVENKIIIFSIRTIGIFV